MCNVVMAIISAHAAVIYHLQHISRDEGNTKWPLVGRFSVRNYKTQPTPGQWLAIYSDPLEM